MDPKRAPTTELDLESLTRVRGGSGTRSTGGGGGVIIGDIDITDDA